MSWKLHEVKEQAILCTREQEVFKADEFIGQIAVRFVTLQVSADRKSEMYKRRC